MPTLHDFVLDDIHGRPLPLADFAGKPVLLVNVASQCGLTPQYTGLQALQREFADKGLVIIGLPCNQFAAQEPGSGEQIEQFCETHYGVTFRLSDKIEVKGSGQHPLYAWLTGSDSPYPGDISWNFEKFLIDESGRLIARFAPRVAPEDAHLRQAVEQAVARVAGH